MNRCDHGLPRKIFGIKKSDEQQKNNSVFLYRAVRVLSFVADVLLYRLPQD